MSFLASSHFLIGLAADQLLPHQCLLCSKFCVGRGVYAACWAGARPISTPLCDRCGRPLPHALPDQLCVQCWQTPPPLAAIRAGFVYNAFSWALILRFKHTDGLVLTPVLGQFLVRHFAALHKPGNLVVPIPLHRHRYLAQHYNQSAELARWLAPVAEFARLVCYANITIKVMPGPTVPSDKRMWPGYSLWNSRAGQPYLSDR